jgi:hypothetical protein
MSSGITFPDFFPLIGVVEGAGDQDTGKVRVRVWGVHPTFESGLLPTEFLPWATAVNGTYSEMVSLPKDGDVVFGMFLDGRDCQQPVLFGTMPNFKNNFPSGSGVDPSGPIRPSNSTVNSAGNPAMPPQISGADLEHTPAGPQIAAMRDTVPTAADTGWSEVAPVIQGNPQTTAVWNGKGGQAFIMIDNDPGGEAIVITHSSGSSIQLAHGGGIKIKSLHNMQSMSEGNMEEYYGGRNDISVEGDYSLNVMGGHSTIYVAGNAEIECQNYNLTARGKATFNVAEGIEFSGSKISMHARESTIDMGAEGAIKIGTEDTFSVSAEFGMDFQSSRDIAMSSESDLDFYGDGSLRIGGGATCHISAGGLVQVEGSPPRVNMKWVIGGLADIPELAEPREVKVPEMEEIGPPKVFPEFNGLSGVLNQAPSPKSTDDGGGTDGFTSTQGVDDTDNGLGNGPDDGTRGGPMNPSEVDYDRIAPAFRDDVRALENDPAWRAKMDEMVEKHGFDRTQIYQIIDGESAFNPSARNPNSDASGLFQFIPSTARGLGETTYGIRQMTPVQQLNVYDNYLSQWNYQSGNHLGMMQAAPAFAKYPPNSSRIVYSRGSAAWRQNPGWRGPDGEIRVKSINDYYNRQR